MGAHAGLVTELRVQAEQEALLASFRTAFHPLSLRHQLDVFADFGNPDGLGFFLNLDDFVTPILGEKDACGWLDG